MNESINLQRMAKAKDEKTINELNDLFNDLKSQNEIYKTTIVDVLQRIPRKSLLVYSTDGRQFPLSHTESGTELNAHSEEAMHITEAAHVYQVFMNHYKKERDIDEAAGYGIGVKIDEKLFFGLWLLDNNEKETLFLNNLEKLDEMTR